MTVDPQHSKSLGFVFLLDLKREVVPEVVERALEETSFQDTTMAPGYVVLDTVTTADHQRSAA